MTGLSLQSVLAPQAIAERISQIDFPGTTFQKLFGWPVTSHVDPKVTGNFFDWKLRSGQYDIFDVSRRIATARVPGQAPSVQAPQKVGVIQYTIPRSAEKISLSDEDMDNRRVIGGTEVDQGGAQYIIEQTKVQAQKVANMIEFQTVAMLRGSYTFDQKDDDLEQRFTGGGTTIDYQIPAGNLNQLDMTGGGDIITTSWATDTSDIPGNILAISAGFLNLTGQGLRHVVMKSPMWGNVLNNTKVQEHHGTAHSPFQTIERTGEGEYTATLAGLPGILFHIVDYGLEIWDGSAYTYTELIEDNHVMFFPEPRPDWAQYIRGGETVTEGPNGARAFHFGYYPYAYPSFEPSGWNMSHVHNGFPALKRPKAVAYADVTG